MRNPAIPMLPYNNMGKTKLYKNKIYEVSEKNNEEN
jgi:ribosomal protein L13